MTSTIDYAASTHFAPLGASASTPSQLASSILAFTPSKPTDTTDTAALAAASVAVARFEADFYPDWFDHVTYTFLALFATFIVVCYGMVWYKIRVADRKMEERERWLESGSGRREDEGDGRETDDATGSDLERGRQEGPRRWSSPSSSSSSLRSPSRFKASYAKEQYSYEESDLDSRPRRRRARTMRTASDTDDTNFSSTSSADTAPIDDDDDLSPVRPSTTRRSLPRRGRTATAEGDQVRAVRYSRAAGKEQRENEGLWMMKSDGYS